METVKIRFMDIEEIKGKERSLFSTLPKERVEKAERFVAERDRLLSLCAGVLVSRYVGEYFTDEFGKPRSDKTFFSVSHSGEKAAIAFCDDGEIGLDIEKNRDEKLSLVKYCLSESEFGRFMKGANFLSFFTAKESLAKADGRGIIKDVKDIPAVPFDGKVVYNGKIYYRHSLQKDGYCVSVTREGKDFKISEEN